MTNAILRIVLVTLAVVLVVAGFILTVRQAGQQNGQTPPHPWFERATWDVRAPSVETLCSTPPPNTADVIFWLPVRKVPTGWQVRCAAATAPDEFLKSTPHADWLIDVEAGAGEDLDNFVDIVDKVAGKRIGIHARSQRAARALRKKAPHWIFAADDASLMRLHLFTSLFLESVFDFWPDFVIAEGGARRAAAQLTAREVTEVRRRRKRVLWDQGTGDEPAPFEVDGILRRTSLK